MPKTLKYIWLVAASLVMLMVIYRVLVYQIFVTQSDGQDYKAMFWLGLRLDARVGAAIALAGFLITWIPGLHPFRRNAGRKLLRIYFFLVALVLLLMYAADLVSLASFNQRLDAKAMKEVFQGTEKSKLFWANLPWLPLLLATGVGLWLWWLYLISLHRHFARRQSREAKSLRIYWQIISIFFLLFLMHGRLSKSPLSTRDTDILSPTLGQKMVTNPVHSLFNVSGE